MAWIEHDRRTGYYKIGFRLAEQRFKKSTQTADRAEAAELKSTVEQTVRAIERGWLTIPDDVDAADFVFSGGRLQQPLTLPKRVTLTKLFDLYFESLPPGNLEDSTIGGMKIHRRQLERILGRSFPLHKLTTADLQRYIERRSKDPGLRGGKVTATTVKRAIVTLRTVWNWGAQHGHIEGRFPNKGLKYPKSQEKPHFVTLEEARKRTATLSEAEIAELWDCVFLTLADIDELLQHVKQRAKAPFVYPLFVLAAHTGARRSEMLRSKRVDIDFAGNHITIHERKKSHDKRTTRLVPMSPLLQLALRNWFTQHPGGEHTFCHVANLYRSKRRTAGTPLSCHEAHDHFKKTLVGTKWERLRGWHVFRHSFCSNCAAKGIDQRIIDAWVGHLSADMVRRYRHLLPDQQQAAITAVFGATTISSAQRVG